MRKDGPDGDQNHADRSTPGTGPRAMFWALTASIALAVIAGLLLGLGWVSLP